jgi:hypothetical protein
MLVSRALQFSVSKSKHARFFFQNRKSNYFRKRKGTNESFFASDGIVEELVWKSKDSKVFQTCATVATGCLGAVMSYYLYRPAFSKDGTIKIY